MPARVSLKKEDDSDQASTLEQTLEPVTISSNLIRIFNSVFINLINVNESIRMSNVLRVYLKIMNHHCQK